MSRLVVEEDTLLVIGPRLATKIGLNETIFIQQLHYWLQDSKHVHDGHRWVYNTYESWQEQFPFWSVSTIRRIIAKLEQEQIIITGNYNRLKIDKTKWYTINYQVLEGINSEERIAPAVQNEEERNVSIDQAEQSKSSEWAAAVAEVSRPLPEITTEKIAKVKETHAPQENPFHFFEQNGFGTIGAYLAEKIAAWCDDLSEELVIEAMKGAVENGSTNWRYVEAILRDWESKGFQTVADIQAAQRAYSERIARKKTKPSPPMGRDIPNGFLLDLCAGEEEE